MENKKPNKMTLITIIVSVVLVLVLIASIFLNANRGLNQTKKELKVELGSIETLNIDVKDYFKVDDETVKELTIDTSKVDVKTVGTYEVYVTFNEKTYTIKVIVEDTKAPKVEMAERIVYTNNIKSVEPGKLVKDVTDESECTVKLIRYEKADTLSEMNELAVKNLLSTIITPGIAEELKNLGTTDIPTEPGLYRGVVEIADTYGNASYEEIYVVFDTTGAEINEVADQVVTVKKDKLSAMPELDKSLYKALDNVDGLITADDFTYEVVLRDEAKHEWIVKVSYTDRAGNSAEAEFLITVQEEKTQSSNKPSSDKNNTSDKNTGNKNESSSDKNNTSDKNNSSSNNNSNTGNSSSSNNNNNNGNNSSSNNNNNNSSSSRPKPEDMDTNKDGFVSEDEEMRYITPEKQVCIDAGYGVICEFDDDQTGGKWYGILMPSSDYEIDGKEGNEILREYLKARNLDAEIYGCWINSSKGWYWYIAENVREYEEDIEF